MVAARFFGGNLISGQWYMEQQWGSSTSTNFVLKITLFVFVHTLDQGSYWLHNLG
ncbi:hypothetical protein GCM10011383_35580 [Hymenobacter cavernae]|uniref:Uncharacterized protein n=1 Tax=Hymenobacter cavernae TaxID=2044852 RepID=A0ABQ1UJW2_9BACT|nr:hypothetical protein GCM10011383_35580 [Hymenobacter cavernae]